MREDKKIELLNKSLKKKGYQVCYFHNGMGIFDRDGYYAIVPFSSKQSKGFEKLMEEEFNSIDNLIFKIAIMSLK